MLRVHLKTGQTTSYDLSDDRQAQALLTQLKDRGFQDTISGITVALNGSQYSVSRPRGLRGVFFQPELIEPSDSGKVKGGVRLTCFAGDVRLTVMVHNADSVRVSLARVGNQIYNPLVDGTTGG